MLCCCFGKRDKRVAADPVTVTTAAPPEHVSQQVTTNGQVAMETNHTGAHTAKKPLKVMIAGAPAAGKGTQCEKIVKKVR
jgi:pantothenate kinase